MKTMACIIALTLLPLAVHAGDATKIDGTAGKKIDTEHERQLRAEEKVENAPVNEIKHREKEGLPEGRQYGVELNPVRFLQPMVTHSDVAAYKSYRSYTGTVSYFSRALNAEFALPFMWVSNKYEHRESGENTRFSLISLDGHYRHFMGDTVNGFYLSGFGRFARLHGRTGEEPVRRKSSSGAPGEVLYTVFDDATHPYKTKNKFGMGVGIGYRNFFKNGMYWGASLSVGRYISGKKHQFIHDAAGGDDEQNIIDVELLKFGYAF